jgi:hypothetical protein
MVNNHSSPINQTNELNEFDESVLVESNMAHQVSAVVMNIISLIIIHKIDKICENCGDNQITKRLVDIYFNLLQTNQSETIKLKVFASIRLLINKASMIFLEGSSALCSYLCLEVTSTQTLHYSNSDFIF